MPPEQGCITAPVSRPGYFVPALILLALLALGALYLSALAVWIKGLSCLALGLYLHRAWCSCPAAGWFVLSPGGEDCLLIRPDGSRVSGRLCGEQFVHQALLALRLGASDRVYHLLLAPQPGGKNEPLRQLRIRLQGNR